MYQWRKGARYNGYEWNEREALLQDSNDTDLTQHIRDLSRLADDGMTLLVDKKRPETRRNLSLLKNVIIKEAQQLKGTDKASISTLASKYITTIQNLSRILSKETEDSDLYQTLNQINKPLHKLIK